MTKRKIESALQKKGIEADRIEYIQGSPTPTGYASGWEVDLSDEVEDAIYIADPNVKADNFMEFDTSLDVMKWIKKLPDLNAK